MEPRILEFPMVSVVGLERTFARGDGGIPDLWKQFHARISEIPNRTGRAAYGVCISKEPEVAAIDYLAAEEVENLNQVPTDMVGRVIGGGLAAIFTVALEGKGIGAEIGGAYQFIWRNWMPGSSYMPTGGYDFERYDERFDSRTLTGEIEIVIPIKPVEG